MKRQIGYKTCLVVGLAGLSLLLTACGGHGSSGNNGGDTTSAPFTTPTSTVLTPNGAGGGAAVALTLTSQSALNAYTGWATNSPTNTQIAVNLIKMATVSNGKGGYDYSFGGAVSFSFTDGNGNYVDTFNSHLQGGPSTVNDTQNNEFNLVSVQYPGLSGLPGYHGFFEGTTYCFVGNGGVGSYSYPMSPDPSSPYYYCAGQVFGGAVILVLNRIGLDADGQGATTGDGSIWFYNFTNGPNPYAPLVGPPGTGCWFITAGPYQCGSFYNGSYINTKTSLYPTVTTPGSGPVKNITYTELGTFTGLDLNSAFNGQL